ncbi:MAG: aminoglycoside phosphotransferase APH(3') [Actinomycetales bacterium]|nr:MAG: aminoglycoside phosphotransferase APH(3') [Actinomycetales bacterium]
MGTPKDKIAIPQFVLDQSDGQPVSAVWVNNYGDVTYQIGTTTTAGLPDFLKVGQEEHEFDIAAHLQRLNWLSTWLPVPKLVSCGQGDDFIWMRTAGLPGSCAIDKANLARSKEVIAALGRGLRRFHDSLPADECPFQWSVESRVAKKNNFTARIPETNPADLVVCHGDACNPNFMIDETVDGDLEVTGYLDLENCGVADRYADLGPATLSLGWNFKTAANEDLFLAAYCGADLTIDEYKLKFYRELWLAE